jgi:methyl-accepting chemotaxis protein
MSIAPSAIAGSQSPSISLKNKQLPFPDISRSINSKKDKSCKLKKLLCASAMKITKRLRDSALILLSFAIVNVIAIYSLVDRMTDDGRVVNYTGIVRGGTQRLVKLELVNLPQPGLIDELDRIINGLIRSDPDLGLPEPQDPHFLEKMQRVEREWQLLKTTIARARENPQWRQALLEESEVFFKLTDAATHAAEEFAQEKVRVSKNSQLILFGLNLLVLIGIYLLVRVLQIQLKNNISTIASSSTEIASSLTEYDEIASLQASSVKQTTTTASELSSTSISCAKEAERTQEAASEVTDLVASQIEQIPQTLMQMRELKTRVGEIAIQIAQLSDRTANIHQISQTVSHFATQTHLLALNASIEASRVTQGGQGFGIVASEIRKLADESHRSTQQIRTIADEIRQATATTEMAMNEGRQTLDEALTVLDHTIASFEEVDLAIARVLHSSQTISQRAEQQAIAIQQLFEAMNAIDRTTVENVQGIGQIKEGVQQLNQVAIDLKTMV